MTPLRTALAAAWLACCGGAAIADDSYSAGLLTMPTLTIGAATYSDVVVEVGGIVSGPTGTGPQGSVDSYDPATGNLTIPFIRLNGVYYYNYVVGVKRLVSIGSVANVDTYDGRNASIPSVEVLGGLVYNSVVATVGQVISTGGGMPEHAIDVYDPATHQLTVAAVMVGGKVYTNPVVTVAGVVSAPEALIYSFGAQSGDGTGPQSGLLQAADGSFYGTCLLGGSGHGGSVFQLTPAGVASVLYAFTGGDDGALPAGGLIQGSDGNLYGTAELGGAHGMGVVFSLAPGGTESVLYSFAGGADGARPHVALLRGADGNFYGATSGQGLGAATVFRLTPDGTSTVLYSFTGGADGDLAAGPLLQASDGSLYGVTGGGGSGFGVAGQGTVFRIAPSGAQTVLHVFTGPDGATPSAGLIQGGDGNFYGSTSAGGSAGCGTVFQVTPAGSETVLHSFACGSDGAAPRSALVQGSDGTFYGATVGGGLYGNGTLFSVTSSGVLSTLYSFGPAPDAARPWGPLTLGSDGHLYGTASIGGSAGTGAVFRH